MCCVCVSVCLCVCSCVCVSLSLCRSRSGLHSFCLEHEQKWLAATLSGSVTTGFGTIAAPAMIGTAPHSAHGSVYSSCSPNAFAFALIDWRRRFRRPIVSAQSQSQAEYSCAKANSQIGNRRLSTEEHDRIGLLRLRCFQRWTSRRRRARANSLRRSTAPTAACSSQCAAN